MALDACKDMTITLRVSLPHREFPLLLHIRVEDLTWKNLLVTLFGHCDFEDEQQLNIQYLRHGRRCNLSNDPRVMSDFIRYALLSPSRDAGVTLLIRKYDEYCNMKKPGSANRPPMMRSTEGAKGGPNFCDSELELNDIVKIFDTKLNDVDIRHGILSDLNANMPYNKLEKYPTTTRVQWGRTTNPAREVGNLAVRRLDNEEFAKIVKSGVNVVVLKDNKEPLLIKFNKESTPSVYEMKLNWSMPDNRTMKCDDLRIPISVEKQMNFVFPQDAEFVKNFETNINVKQTGAAKPSKDQETTPQPSEPTTPSWPGEKGSCQQPSTSKGLPMRSTFKDSWYLLDHQDKGNNEKTKPRSSINNPAACVVSRPGKRGDPWITQAIKSNIPGVKVHQQRNFPPRNVPACFSTHGLKLDAATGMYKLVSDSRACQTAEGTQSPSNSDTAEEDSTISPPKWLKAELDKFKEQVNDEMKKTMQSIIDAIQQTKMNSASTSGHSKHFKKSVPAELITGLETLALNDRKHREGSRKRKVAVPAPGKVLEISPDLSIFSMSGFKVRMPRNASMTLKLTLLKYGKFRTSREEPEPRVTSASDGIECCVTPAGVENMYSWYDIRIKTKDKSGKFRLIFNIVHNGKQVGRSVHIGVRVKKTYTLPVVPDVTDLIDLNSEPLKYEAEREGAVADVASGSRAFEDEGIGGNQEDFYSPSSDSEDSMDADETNLVESKNDVPKDEGIDTCYPVAKMNEANWEVFSESDTDSSISFLMDENEARDRAELESEVVNLPSCFVPNTDSNEGTLSVRIIRKRDHSRAIKKGKTTDTASGSGLDSFRAWNTSASSRAWNDAETEESPIPESETAENESTLADEREQAERAYNRSIYPNLQGLKEFVNPLPEKPAASGASNDTPKPSSPGTKAEPCPNILHEKVFEAVGNVWNKVYQTKKSLSEAENLPQQVKETVTCVAAKAVQEAKAAVTAAQAAAAAAAHAVPAQTNVSAVFDPESLESAARAVVAAASAAQAAMVAATTAVYTPPSQTTTPVSTPTTPQPSTSVNEPKPATTSRPSMSANEPEPKKACASSSSSAKSAGGKEAPKKNAADGNSMYKYLPEDIRQKLIYLNEMGFTDDPYSIYLLEQFPNDLDKVIESLINYSSV